MKIDNKIGLYEIVNQQPATSQNIAAKSEKPSDSAKLQAEALDSTDQDVVVHLSQATKEVQLAHKVIAAEPDVRADKVAEMKQKIKSGTYQIDHQAVAGKLVDTFLAEM